MEEIDSILSRSASQFDLYDMQLLTGEAWNEAWSPREGPRPEAWKLEWPLRAGVFQGDAGLTLRIWAKKRREV